VADDRSLSLVSMIQGPVPLADEKQAEVMAGMRPVNALAVACLESQRWNKCWVHAALCLAQRFDWRRTRPRIMLVTIMYAHPVPS
jgi:hypothetical protein